MLAQTPSRVQVERRLNRSHSEYTLEAAGQRAGSATSIAAGSVVGESTGWSMSAAGIGTRGAWSVKRAGEMGAAGHLSWPARRASLLLQAVGPLTMPYEVTAPSGRPHSTGLRQPLVGLAAAAVASCTGAAEGWRYSSRVGR